jgi:hypothetical protein
VFGNILKLVCTGVCCRKKLFICGFLSNKLNLPSIGEGGSKWAKAEDSFFKRDTAGGPTGAYYFYSDD